MSVPRRRGGAGRPVRTPVHRRSGVAPRPLHDAPERPRRVNYRSHTDRGDRVIATIEGKPGGMEADEIDVHALMKKWPARMPVYEALTA